jgi:iron complex outermembrane receptor protein
VLRGPQGTLYGEGSVGGTIRFITKNPVLNHFQMNADVAAMFTEDGTPSQRIESVVNVPLIDNELGLRIASTFEHDGGWINQPGAAQRDYNDQNLADVRVKGLWYVSIYCERYGANPSQ